MKKLLTGVLAAIVLLSVGATGLFAAAPGAGSSFIDADGDGFCDRAGSFCGYIDTDQDGVCDHLARRPGSGRADREAGDCFLDGDGDGICDRYGDSPGCLGGQGRGNGFRGGRGR